MVSFPHWGTGVHCEGEGEIVQRLLEKVGRASYDHPFHVLMSWAILLGFVTALALMNYSPVSTSIQIPDTKAQKALQTMHALFPQAGQSNGQLVIATERGKEIDGFRQQISEIVEATREVPGVLHAVDPFFDPRAISQDRRVAIINVSLINEHGATEAKTIDGVASLVKSRAMGGLSIERGGDLVPRTPGKILGPKEAIGVGIAIMVLVLTLGSLVAAGLPVLTALLSVGIAMAGLFSLSNLVEINSVTPALAVMLGLAVGIDYSLFVISKLRMYLLAGATERDAAIHAIRVAGSAVVFAALTVVIALSALSAVGMPILTSMGLAAAATVALVATVAVTALPAMFRLIGIRMFSRKTQGAMRAALEEGFVLQHKIDTHTLGYRWASLLGRHPILGAVVPIALIAVLALPVRSLELGLPTDQYAPKDSTERKAYDAVARGFGPGYNAPLLVVAQGLEPVTTAERDAAAKALTEQLTQRLEMERARQASLVAEQLASATTLEARLAVEEGARAKQQQVDEQAARARAVLSAQVGAAGNVVHVQQIADEIAKRPDVVSARAVMATPDGQNGTIQVVPRGAPMDTSTRALMESLRDSKVQQQWSAKPISYGVTGTTALQLDINARMNAAVPKYLFIVIGLSLILLVLAFRSFLVPLKATLGFVLSTLAMFGALVAVFQWGWLGITDSPSPIMTFIPIIGTGILFGLAMDYEFFLVSSMHEEYMRTGDARQAVMNGFSMGSTVVTAAAIIMVCVFAGFISNDDVTVRPIGFALAIGVFIDAFLVRMTIVPAVMTLLGRRAWWLPQSVDRVLPHVVIDDE